MNEKRISDLLAPVLARHGLELEALEVVPAGGRRLVRVVVDGDGPDGRGPLLDDIAEASQACSAELDAADAVAGAAYTLEVSSRGTSRPLTLPRHWRRNTGRLVAVTTTTGERLTGRVLVAQEDRVRLVVDRDEREVAYAEVRSALVQVELTKPGASRSGDAEDPGVSEDD